MRRKVVYEMRMTQEAIIEVPDHIAKGPEEKTWLYEHTQLMLAATYAGSRDIVSMVVTDPDDTAEISP